MATSCKQIPYRRISRLLAFRRRHRGEPDTERAKKPPPAQHGAPIIAHAQPRKVASTGPSGALEGDVTRRWTPTGRVNVNVEPCPTWLFTLKPSSPGVRSDGNRSRRLAFAARPQTDSQTPRHSRC